MRNLLDSCLPTPGGTVSELLGALRASESRINICTNRGDGIIPRVLTPFVTEPNEMFGELLYFAGTVPRILAETAGEYIQGHEVEIDEHGHMSREGQVIMDIASTVKRMGSLLDNYTRDLAAWRPWTLIQRESISAISIWRTRNDEILGDPTQRKVQIEQLPNAFSSLVAVEGGVDVPKKVMLALSDARYRPGGDGSSEAREDFLIDLAELFEYGFASKKSPASIRLMCQYTEKLVFMSQPLLDSTISLARLMSELGILNDPEGIFEVFEAVRRGLRAEDSPNAKVEIGGWA